MSTIEKWEFYEKALMMLRKDNPGVEDDRLIPAIDDMYNFLLSVQDSFFNISMEIN